jgi:hypothetical protein
MLKFSTRHVAIYAFAVVVAVLLVLALYGWLTGIWEVQP